VEEKLLLEAGINAVKKGFGVGGAGKNQKSGGNSGGQSSKDSEDFGPSSEVSCESWESEGFDS
jgi:hypothetical protein